MYGQHVVKEGAVDQEDGLSKQQWQLQAACPWRKMKAEHSEWGKLSTALEKEFVPKYDARFHQQDRTQ